jgi:CelD/BcsL family acetyltransferase involved in cellulose biosynthesis
MRKRVEVAGKGQAMRVETIETLEGLRQTWDRLAEACPTGHPQYLYEWIEPWWRRIGSARHTLFSLRVESDAQIVAIAPFMLVCRRVRGLAPLREIQWLATGPSDQADVLSAGSARDVGTAVAQHLIKCRRSWDELHLQCVPEESEAVLAMLDVLRSGLKCTISVKRTPNYYIDTAGDWAAYLRTTSKKFVRRDLPRVQRRLAESGDVTVRHDREADIGGLLAQAIPVHRARQHELRRESTLADQDYAGFVADAFEGLKDLGKLSVWVLRVGQDIAGYLVGFEAGGVFYAWNMAHNPAYGAASPGKILWAKAIEGCFEDETIHEFNMMRGDTEYKHRWTSTYRDLLNIRVRNLATARSAFLNGLRRAAV